jgi:hypothetical protein
LKLEDESGIHPVADRSDSSGVIGAEVRLNRRPEQMEAILDPIADRNADNAFFARARMAEVLWNEW